MSKYDYDQTWSGFDTRSHVTDVFSGKPVKKPAGTNALSCIDMHLEDEEYRELDPSVYAYPKSN